MSEYNPKHISVSKGNGKVDVIGIASSEDIDRVQNGVDELKSLSVIYPVDISKVGSDNNILYIEIPDVTSYDDLDGKIINLYTGVYVNNTYQTVYLNINGYGARAIKRIVPDGRYYTDKYNANEINRYTVMQLYISGSNVYWVNPTTPTLDTSLSSTSTNPVQNKVIKTALDAKADTSHSHTKSEISDFPTSMTPTSHASDFVMYGKGTDSLYGHVRLSDSVTSETSASGGTAATPKAVKIAYDKAVEAYDKAESSSSISAKSYDGVDMNSVTDIGIHSVNASSNKPESETYYTVIVGYSSPNSISYIHQIAIAEMSYNVYIRLYDNGTWSDWQLINSNITIDSSLSSTSTNPVQNKVIKSALDGKLPTSHEEVKAQYTTYGHVELNDAVDNSSDQNSGQAASCLAVKTAYDKAVEALEAAENAGGSVTVDGALSSTSTNPVQNKVIISALDDKLDWNFSSNGYVGMDEVTASLSNWEDFKGKCIEYYSEQDIKFKDTVYIRYLVPGDAPTSFVGTSDKPYSNIYSKNLFYAQSCSQSSDYAICREWVDGNPNNEDHIGKFVVQEGRYIRLATSKDTDTTIMGAISGNYCILENSAPTEWKNKYLTDIYGRVQTHTVHYPAETTIVKVRTKDDNGNNILEEKEIVVREEMDVEEPIINPEFDETKEYIPRMDRPEYDAVGVLGILVVDDDGTCEVGGFCMPNDDSIATKSENGFYVEERLDSTHIKISMR